MGPTPLCLLACLLSAPDYTRELPPPRYRLEQVKYIEAFVGSPKAREALAQHGFIVTEQQFSRMSEAYQARPSGRSYGEEAPAPRIPKFITVDSAWDAYHAILGSAVHQLEERQGPLLLKFSTRLQELAAARSKGQPGVYADLAEFAAVALALNNGVEPASRDEEDLSPLSSLSSAIQQYIEGSAQESIKLASTSSAREIAIRAIREGRDPQRVLFFELPLMPQRFRMAGAGGKWAPLPGGLAARQWYASCVFRLNSDAETERAIHLALLIDEDKELSALYERLTAPYEALIGPPDSADVPQYAILARRVLGEKRGPAKIAASLAAFRRAAAALPDPKVNDQRLTPEQQKRFAAEIKGFRLLPPRLLPGMAILQQTAEPNVRGRPAPSGLDVFCVGPLACPSARRALRAALGRPEIIDGVFRAPAAPLARSIAGRTLDLSRSLQAPLPVTAPATLRTSTWQDKQVWCALGALAQQQYAFSYCAGDFGTNHPAWHNGRDVEPLGYVSPYPEFFRRLAALARDTAAVFDAATDQPAPDAQEAGKLLLNCLAACHAKLLPFGDDMNLGEEDRDFGQLQNLFAEYFGLSPDKHPRLIEPGSEQWWYEANLRALAHRWLAGRDITPADHSLMRTLSRPAGAGQHIAQFTAMCDTLASIADKQLGNQPLSHDEYRLIRDYGAMIGRYSTELYRQAEPGDDPFSDGTPNGKLLAAAGRGEGLTIRRLFAGPTDTNPVAFYAATARPEAMYVILEINGQPVLHRGAVMSYREFLRPANETVSDRSWAAEVREGKAAPPPAFTAAFRQTITEEEVLAMLRAGQVYEPAGQMLSPVIKKALFQTLRDGLPQDQQWFLHQICARATNEDVGELLALMRKLPVEFAAELTVTMERLNWTKHRAAVMELLHADVPALADAAAYLLARRPERIDIATLAANFRKQKPRTRRLYCYLAGKVKWTPSPLAILAYSGRDEKATALLCEALRDESPGVRYQAAIAVIQRGSRRPEIVDRLLPGLNDPNQMVAAAMARALVELKAKQAAPAMLDRLRKIVHGKPLDSEELDRQQEAVNQDTNHNGSYRLMVLAGHSEPGDGAWPQINGLVEELLDGLGKFRHGPAADLLREMLAAPPKRGEDEPQPPRYGQKAMEILVELDAKGKGDLAVRVALDRKADIPARAFAVGLIGETKDPAAIEKLLPLLSETEDDAQPADNDPFFDQHVAIAQAAAAAISSILADPEATRKVPAPVRKRATAQLHAMLNGVRGPAALEALVRIGMKNQDEFLAKIAFDKSAPVDLRIAALGHLRQNASPQSIRSLLPLLEETEGEHGRICEQALQHIMSAVQFDNRPNQREAACKLIEPRLREMLRGERGQVVYNALQQIHRNDVSDLLVSFARDPKLSGELRIRALRELAWQGDLACVRALLPLLDDGTELENQVPVSHYAASTIAMLLGDRVGYGNNDTDPAAQAEFVRQVRQSVFEAGIK